MNKLITIACIASLSLSTSLPAMNEGHRQRLDRTLIKAGASGDLQKIQKLIRQGATIDAINIKDKWTALMQAAYNGHQNCARALIKAGATVDQTDEYECTALMWAAAKGHEKCVSTLLGAGAKIHQEDNQGCTAMMHAAKFGHTKCVSILIDAGANYHRADKNGCSGLMHAAANGNPECVSLLIDMKANLYKADNGNRTALMRAADHKHKKICEILVDAMRKQKEQKQIIVILLGIRKKAGSLLKTCYIPQDIVKLIGRYSLELTKQTNDPIALKEIQKITNTNGIKEDLLSKYFPNHSKWSFK